MIGISLLTKMIVVLILFPNREALLTPAAFTMGGKIYFLSPLVTRVDTQHFKVEVQLKFFFYLPSPAQRNPPSASLLSLSTLPRPVGVGTASPWTPCLVYTGFFSVRP